MSDRKYYIVRRCRKDNTLYGLSHASYCGGHTVCDQDVDSSWWIVATPIDSDGFHASTVTCKKCLKYLKIEANRD